MAIVQLALKGPSLGSAVTLALSDGVNSDSDSVTSFRKPLAASLALPRVSDGFDGDTLTVDTSALTGVSSYQWISNGVDIGGATGTTLSAATRGDQQISVRVVCNEGTLTSPEVLVYTTGSMASHDQDDAAIVALVPHSEVTRVAVADGSWCQETNWLPQGCPQEGDFVLIPNGRNIVYDETQTKRLDRIRVDGTLRLDTATLTNEQLKMFVETWVETRSGTIQLGTAASNVPDAAQFDCTFSYVDYKTATAPLPTNLNADNFLATRGWGRGFISQGNCVIWGRERDTHLYAAEELSAGATSVTLPRVTDWAVGETIYICATDGPLINSNSDMQIQTELREITSITNGGLTLNWTTPLVYDHGNPVAGSTRTDVFPVIALYRGKNVIFQGEYDDVPSYQRAHTAFVHHYADPADIWRADFHNLGRTDKTIFSGIIDPVTNNFRKCKRDSNGIIQASDPIELVALDETSNLQSRYSVHMHHPGFSHSGARPVVAECHAAHNPGWLYVHHAGDCDFFDNIGYDFLGSGMVSESANELGAWADNLMMVGTTHFPANANLLLAPKVLETGGGGEYGDVFRYCTPFGFRGRQMRTNRNIGVGGPSSYTWFPRGSTDPATVVAPIVRQRRSRVDVGETGRIEGITVGTDFGAWGVEPAPIIHNNDNASFAAAFGMSVTKANGFSGTDVNIKFENFKAVGGRGYGVELEYVWPYLLQDVDIIGNYDIGIWLGTNSAQIGTIRARIEGCTVGMSHDCDGDTAFDFGGLQENLGFAPHDLYDNTANPRWYHIGYNLVNCGTDFTYSAQPDGATKTTQDVVRLIEDVNDDFIDYTQSGRPSETLPLKWADWDGTTITNLAGNTDGGKVNQLGTSDWAVRPSQDVSISRDGNKFNNWRFNEGRWQFDLGAGSQDVLVIPEIISDPVTAYPEKIIKMVGLSGAAAGVGTDNGAFTRETTAIVRADIVTSVAAGGSVLIDVAGPATGGDGTYRIDRGDYIGPQNGTISIDYSGGTLTYTPDAGVTQGTDEFHVLLLSGYNTSSPQNVGSIYKGVKINVLIGSDVTISAPVVDTHFSVVDGGGNTIAATLIEQPDVAGRRINTVQYSTDSGSTWRRLCNKWINGVHTIKHLSSSSASYYDVAASVPTGAQNVSIRYITNYPDANQTSAGSANDAVTVT